MKVFIITLGIIIPSVLMYLMIAREMKFKLIKEGVSFKGFIPSFPVFNFTWDTLSENGKHRLEFCFLLFLIIVGVAVTTSKVYPWLWEHKGLMFFMFLITIGYIIRPPKSTWVLKTEVLVLLLMGIYQSLPQENSVSTLIKATKNSASPMSNKQVARASIPQGRVIEVVAMQGAFTEVPIPASTDFRWEAAEGCLVAVVYDADPRGSVHDCAEHIDLGKDIHNLRLGFSSKTETPIRVVVKLTPV